MIRPSEVTYVMRIKNGLFKWLSGFLLLFVETSYSLRVVLVSGSQLPTPTASGRGPPSRSSTSELGMKKKRKKIGFIF